MLRACRGGHLSVCQWLVLNGALNDPTTQHVTQAIVIRDTHPGFSGDHRPALLAWAQEDILAVHDTFLNVVLRASVLVPLSQQPVSPDGQCRLPRLFFGDLKLVGSFLGVERGRRLRNVRELSAVLAVHIDDETDFDPWHRGLWTAIEQGPIDVE